MALKLKYTDTKENTALKEYFRSSQDRLLNNNSERLIFDQLVEHFQFKPTKQIFESWETLDYLLFTFGKVVEFQ